MADAKQVGDFRERHLAQRLAARLGPDPAGSQEPRIDLVASFLVTVPRRLTELAGAFARQDGPAFRAQAQLLRRCVAELGATRLAALASQLEDGDSIARPLDIPGLLAQLELEFDLVGDALHRLLVEAREAATRDAEQGAARPAALVAGLLV